MKKLLAIIALVVFLAGTGAPAIAQNTSAAGAIELADKDPKKAKKSETTKESEGCKSSCEKSCDDKK